MPVGGAARAERRRRSRSATWTPTSSSTPTRSTSRGGCATRAGSACTSRGARRPPRAARRPARRPSGGSSRWRATATLHAQAPLGAAPRARCAGSRRGPTRCARSRRSCCPGTTPRRYWLHVRATLHPGPRRGAARGGRELQRSDVAERVLGVGLSSPCRAREAATRRRASAASARASARSCGWKKRVSSSSGRDQRQPAMPRRQADGAVVGQQQLAGYRDAAEDRGELREAPPLEADAEQPAREQRMTPQHRDVGAAQRDARAGDAQPRRVAARAPAAARRSREPGGGRGHVARGHPRAARDHDEHLVEPVQRPRRARATAARGGRRSTRAPPGAGRSSVRAGRTARPPRPWRARSRS